MRNNKDEQERRQLNRKLIKRTFMNQMKNIFMASLCKNGILGGYIIIDADAIIYRTGKASIPEKYKNLEMKYKDIFSVTEGSLLFLPTVMVKMKNEEKYKFVLFARKRFLAVLNEKRTKR